MNSSDSNTSGLSAALAAASLSGGKPHSGSLKAPSASPRTGKLRKNLSSSGGISLQQQMQQQMLLQQQQKQLQQQQQQQQQQQGANTPNLVDSTVSTYGNVRVTGISYGLGSGRFGHGLGSRRTLTTGTMSTLHSIKGTPGSSQRPTPTTSIRRPGGGGGGGGGGSAAATPRNKNKRQMPTRHKRPDEVAPQDPSATLLKRLNASLASPAYRRTGFLIRSWNACYVQITGSVMVLWDGHSVPVNGYVPLEATLNNDPEFKKARKMAKKRNQKVVRLRGYVARIDPSIKPKSSSASVTASSFSPSFTYTESPAGSPVPSDFMLGSPSVASSSAFSPYMSPRSPTLNGQSSQSNIFDSSNNNNNDGDDDDDKQQQHQQQQQQQMAPAGDHPVRFVTIVLTHPTERNYTFSVDATHADYWLHVLNRAASAPSISDFVVLKKIGTGGYGKVFLTRNRKTRKLYALKQVRKYVKPKPIVGSRGEILTTKAAMREQVLKTRQRQIRHVRYMMEERIALQELGAHNPFICRSHMAFEDNLFWYFVLDFCPGGDVFHHAQKQELKCFDEATVRVWIAELIVALEYMHKRHWVHRDIKPENLLLEADGHLRLADFGFVKQLPKPFSGSNSFCGTKYYIAPELLIGDRSHGFAVDLWALGVLVYELTCGIPPFYHKRRQRVYEMILNDPVVFPDDVELSGAVKHFITALLIKEPHHRMGTGAEGISALRRHTWFKGLDWAKLERRAIQPGFQPPIDPKLERLVKYTNDIDNEELGEIMPSDIRLSDLLTYSAEADGFEPTVDGTLDNIQGFDYVASECDLDHLELALDTENGNSSLYQGDDDADSHKHDDGVDHSNNDHHNHNNNNNNHNHNHNNAGDDEYFVDGMSMPNNGGNPSVLINGSSQPDKLPVFTGPNGAVQQQQQQHQ